MRFRILLASLVLILFNVSWAGALETKHQPYVPGELLVKFKPGLRSTGLSYVKSAWRVSELRSFDLIGVVHLKLPAGLSVEKAVEFFKNDQQVEYAEPNYIYRLRVNIPNDPLFGSLWGQNNTGQTVGGTYNLNNPGMVDADMDLPEAWMTLTDCSQVIVAVLDTGIDYNHPDLVNNIWINPGEIPGNGIDDDNNGYVDDAQGWDFVDDDPDPMDYEGHGTHVAGTIAAEGNNGLGVVGVCWQAKVMAVRVLNALGSGSTADIITGLTYAGAMGAEVINLSLGGSAYSQALKDAIDASSALVVCAAGNDGTDNDISPKYPASYASLNIMAVAAGDQADALASFSNYGLASVDVMAPGVNIQSLLPARETVWTENFDDGDFSDWTTDHGLTDTWGLSTSVFKSSPWSLAVNRAGNYL
ncbi:MAG: S8 family peptidase, partial [Pseudomonadota bacterium]